MKMANEITAVLRHPRHRVFAAILSAGLILLFVGAMKYGTSMWSVRLSDSGRNQSQKENSSFGVLSFRQYAGKLYRMDEISGPDQSLTSVIHSRLNTAQLNDYLFETGTPETSQAGEISVERMSIRLKNLPPESIGRIFEAIEHQEPVLRIHEAELNSSEDGTVDARFVIERWIIRIEFES